MDNEHEQGRRTWIKLWVGNCLRGTMIEELVPAERWAFIGLLLLCGDSPFQPLVCVSPEVGYTDEQIAHLIDVPVLVWRKAKEKMLHFEKIEIDDMNVIKVRNWRKYQSDYQRQKPYRKGIIPEKSEPPPPQASKVEKKRYEIRKEVIEYLNKKTGKLYQPSAQESLKHINARIGEGATLEHFIKCIDNKVLDWKGTDYEMYLRPTTLFNSEKFWGYVNQSIATKRERKDEVGKTEEKQPDWKDGLSEKERLMVPALKAEYQARLKKYMESKGFSELRQVDVGREVPSSEYYLKSELEKIREGERQPPREE